MLRLCRCLESRKRMHYVARSPAMARNAIRHGFSHNVRSRWDGWCGEPRKSVWKSLSKAEVIVHCQLNRPHKPVHHRETAPAFFIANQPLAPKVVQLVHATLGVRPPDKRKVRGSDSQDRMNQDRQVSNRVLRNGEHDWLQALLDSAMIGRCLGKSLGCRGFMAGAP